MRSPNSCGGKGYVNLQTTRKRKPRRTRTSRVSYGWRVISESLNGNSQEPLKVSKSKLRELEKLDVDDTEPVMVDNRSVLQFIDLY